MIVRSTTEHMINFSSQASVRTPCAIMTNRGDVNVENPTNGYIRCTLYLALEVEQKYLIEKAFPSVISTCLHPDNGIDEEEHGNEEADIWQSLEGLNERPQEDSYGVALS